MLRFRQFIAEGGNITFGKKGDPNAPVASPFPVTAKTRSAVRSDIHDALSSIHDSFHKKTGEHLFGDNKQRLNDGSAYAGSTHDLMGSHVSDQEFAKYKPSVGDIDVQIPHEHKDTLADHFQPGQKYGKFKIVGVKKHGNETSIGMRHADNGIIHQVDFQGVHNPGSEEDRFLHNSSWADTKAGMKGLHHKFLINAVGGQTHKFSITHGLRSRTDESDPGVKHPDAISSKLFGPKADHSKIRSFLGTVDLIKKHIPKERHQEIYDKFKDSLKSKKDTDHSAALTHMRKHLNVRDDLTEETAQERHVHVAFMGASPHTHMGHIKDVVSGMGQGSKFVGLSGKSDAFTDKERADIANRQAAGTAEFKVEKTAGQTVGRAFNSLSGTTGKKILHLHFGHDRKEMAERLRNSIQAGKIPELNGVIPDDVHIHYPKDENRSHGMSGTKMREAAVVNDLDTYHHHLGPYFTRDAARKIMNKTQKAMSSGQLAVKRK